MCFITFLAIYHSQVCSEKLDKNLGLVVPPQLGQNPKNFEKLDLKAFLNGQRFVKDLIGLDWTGLIL